MSARPFLFLIVDAVPWEIAEEAWASGRLPGFARPRPMISVFPSLTNVAVSALLAGVFDQRPPGYEALYVDAGSGDVRGGYTDPASEAALAPLHGRPRGFLAHVAVYVLRRPLVYGQIHWITRQFLQGARPWLAYVPATDGVAHFDGRTALARSFHDICNAVTAARMEYRRRNGVLPGVVMCSDHGMAFGRLRHLETAAMAHALRDGGFRVGEKGERGVRLIAYGDVGGGVVYGARERAVEVAEIVSRVQGVDVAFGRDGDGCTAFAMRSTLESARLRWRGERYAYEPIQGDPLAYAPVWDELRRSGRADDGWVGDEDLLAATWMQRYPDALARVRHGMEDVVRNPAPVLFSMRETWTYGPPLTHIGAEFMGGQVATHGALTAAESLGFATCSEDDEPEAWRAAPALRPEQVLRPWRPLVRAGAAR